MTKEGKLSYSKEIMNVLSTQGVRGLYSGFWASALRDVPGWAVYFAAFEQLKSMDRTQSEYQRFLWTMNAGGLAGALSWLVSLP